MKRKDYRKPTMKVVKLQQQTHLLAWSVDGTRTGYGTTSTNDGTEQTWE